MWRKKSSRIFLVLSVALSISFLAVLTYASNPGYDDGITPEYSYNISAYAYYVHYGNTTYNIQSHHTWNVCSRVNRQIVVTWRPTLYLEKWVEAKNSWVPVDAVEPPLYSVTLRPFESKYWEGDLSIYKTLEKGEKYRILAYTFLDNHILAT